MKLSSKTRQFVASASVALMLMAGGTVPASAFDGGKGSSGSSSGGGNNGGGNNGGGNNGGGNNGGAVAPVAGAAVSSNSLKSVAIPAPPDAASYVKDQVALVALGKALFWDMQVGNDGKQACATCHFHAGADHRRTNQLHGNGSPFTVNYTMGVGDFPFHGSTIAGSAGVFDRNFNDVVPGSAVDDGLSVLDSTYNVAGTSVRRVTGRNTPTVINAVFNVRNFWDGRAKDVFTVFTPFGDSDPSNNVVMESAGKLTSVKDRIQHSSLASQSVGPPNNGTEMSSSGRNWPKLGKKMLSLTPLANQRIHPQDSVLGSYAKASGTGMNGATYMSMVQAAFQPQYWNSTRMVNGSGIDMGLTGAPISTSQYSQAEWNFALFWGMSIQAYESTLVSNATPVDQAAEGNKAALSAQAAQGQSLFNSKCGTCHSGPEFAGATYTAIAKQGATQGLGHGLVTDTGFFHTGVRPTAEDIGVGGNDGFGKPLSIANSPAGVNGAFKTPTIRNTEFTGPYFHNGGASTLEQVVDFYSRGGDTPGDANLGPGIQALNLNASDKAALVAFMKALSDDRVRFERAPFDHPQLCVADGEKTTAPSVLMLNASIDSRFTHEAMDNMVELQEVGSAGGPALQSFAELIGASAASGPRAHDLATACTMK
jgi:cytochrome c peroxidase